MVDVCPYCGANGVPLLYGLPVGEARLAARDGELALGGCVEPDEPPRWQCARDHRWRGGDDALWQERLLAVLTSYGYLADDGG